MMRLAPHERTTGYVSEPTSRPAQVKRNGDRAPKTTSDSPKARPKINMQELNPFFGAFCLLAALGAYLTRAYFASAALVFVGTAFLLYWRDMRAWEEIPRWKRITVATLIFVGGACLVGYIISTGGF